MVKSVTGSGDTNPIPEEIDLMRTKEDYGIENVEIISNRMLMQMCEKLDFKVQFQF
jgi:hypothetical protein